MFKVRGDVDEDLLSSATGFLKAADRCLNGNKVEPNIEILVVPGAVCAALSCELFLKYILLREVGQHPKEHRLASLFRLCSAEVQAALSRQVPDIMESLERNNTQFVDGRYHFEQEQFSFRQGELLQVAESLSQFVRSRFRKASP